MKSCEFAIRLTMCTLHSAFDSLHSACDTLHSACPCHLYLYLYLYLYLCLSEVCMCVYLYLFLRAAFLISRNLSISAQGAIKLPT